MNTSPTFQKVWRWVKWPLIVLLVGYAVLVGFRVKYWFDVDKTNAAVAEIHAQRLTMADVDGTTLPPQPDPATNNATVAGIDANQNGIRDDVELAIFEKYPNDKKSRAASLQYAKALQMELTHVFNSETLIAVIQMEDKGSLCVGDNDTQIEETRSLVFNTPERNQKREENQKYLTSFSLDSYESCDIQDLR